MLLTVSLLCSLMVPALAADPVESEPATSHPAVTVEGNAVIDVSGNFTGFFEIALKVRTEFYFDASGNATTKEDAATTETHDFHSASVALRYNADLLTPVDWSEAANPVDVTGAVSGASETFVSLDTKKPDDDILTIATVEGYTEGNTADGTPATALLTLHAGASIDVTYPKETAVCVVRFKFNDPTAANADLADSARNVFMYALAPDTTPDTGVTLPDPAYYAAWLAEDAAAAETTSAQVVWYEGTVNSDLSTLHYYFHGAEGYIAGGISASVVPATAGAVVNAGTNTAADYKHNLLSLTKPGQPGGLEFTLVNQLSYANTMDLDKVAPILFYDWDNTLLGVLVVEKGKDVRNPVNEFVSQWIHKKIIDAAPSVSSLTRADTYRGKYPTTPMTESAGVRDPSVVTDGEDYPLTNKLDYVFFKRPMEQVLGTTDADGDGALDPIPNQWRQTDDVGDGTGTATWDEKFPYVHGWANCVDAAGAPDPAMVESTWTTLGMGELSGYNGANIGGYKDMGTAPAEFTYTSDDVTFTFADFQTGVDGPTYVKAVYEPGVELMTMYYTYRMVHKPYYNKLNSLPAQTGGVYNVDITFERSNESTDGVRGVARIREPVVRQNTTTDVKWEEETLISASANEAYNTRAKTTYTKIDVANTEQIPFAMALSGRHNHVDYYLAENYGSNFVSGGARTSPNGNYRTADTSSFAIDNYNYAADDSITDDVYYDAPYQYRDGTHGFVLYGTLNSLMEVATQAVVDPANSTLASYVSQMVLADANLRLEDGTAPSTMVQIDNMTNLLMEAATAAKTAHDSGNNAYWNVEKNCAQLTYHQLQGFILNGSLDHDETPVDGLTWCHLHDECAADLVNKPETWKDLMEKAAGSEIDQSDIALLNRDEIEGLTHLRVNAAGEKWSDPEDFKDALVEAVNILTGFNTGMAATDLTWDMVQYAILNRAGISAENAATTAAESYWWYDGATEDDVLNWTELVASAADAVNALTLPDDSITQPPDEDTPYSGRDAKLNRVQAAFEANADTEAPDPAAWIAATHNLAKNADGEKFDSFDDFKDAVKAAVYAALAAGEAQENITWEKIQYHILNSEYPRYPSEDDTNEMAAYWWKDGGTKITDLESLMTAVVNGDDLRLSLLTTEEITNVLNLRAVFNGKAFASVDDLAAVAADYLEALRVKNGLDSLNAVLRGTYISQDSFQYYIFHGALPGTGIVAATEAQNYYWWSYDSARVPVSIATDSTDELGTLLEAAYRAGVNGYDADALEGFPGAWHTDFDLNGVTALRFYTGDNDGAITDRANLTPVPLTDFKAKLEALARLTYTDAESATDDVFIANAFDASKLDWYTVQFYLINDRLPVDGNADDQAEMDGYWWKEKDSSTEVILTLLDQLNAAMEDALKGNTSALTAFSTVANLGQSGLNFKVTNGRSKSFITDANSSKTLATFNTCIENLKTALAADSDYWNSDTKTLTPLTWYQYQHAVYASANGLVPPDSSSMATYTWAPDWVTASAASAGILTLRPVVYEDQYTAETTVSEDGLTTTLVETLGTWNADLGDYDWTITTTVTQRVGELIVTTITVTTMTYDPDTWQPIFTTTTQTQVSDAPTGDQTYGLEEDTTLIPVQPEDETVTTDPEEGTTETTPEDEATTTDPEDETPETTPEEETTTTTPEEETTETIPEEEATEATPGDETTTADPEEETTETIPEEETTETDPGGETTDAAPEEETTETDPGGGTTDATPEEEAVNDGSAADTAPEEGADGDAALAAALASARLWLLDRGVALGLTEPLFSFPIVGAYDTGQLYGSQRDGPLGPLSSRSEFPTVRAS